MPDNTGQMMADPPPALVESITGVTSSLTQARTLGKLSVRDRELVATAAAIAVGLTWGAIVHRAARDLCICAPGTPNYAGPLEDCPVHDNKMPDAIAEFGLRGESPPVAESNS